jgi:hypothetical protein
LRANKDKSGTPEFQRVAEVYKQLRTGQVATQAAPGSDPQIADTSQQGESSLMEQIGRGAQGLAGNFAGGAVEALLTLPGAVNDLALMGVDKVGQQFGAKPLTPEQYANNPFGSQNVKNMFEAYVSPDIFGPKPTNKAEEYARRIGEFVGPGAALAPAKLIAPVVTAGVTGGIGSQAAQDAFPDNPWAPVVGGLLGGIAPSAVSAVRSARVPTGGMTQETARLAQDMIDEGIDLFPGQVGTKPAKIVYDAVSKVPFTGNANRARQLRQFNSAVARTFGEQADAITPQVMSRARERIGGMFNNVFERNNIFADQKLLDDLADVQLRATTNLTDAQANDVGKAIASIMTETNKGGGVLNGRKYHAFTSKGGALQNLTSSADPNIKYYAGQVREAMDDAFARFAAPEDVAMLNDAKRQYRAMKVVQDLVPKAADGNISPALLLQKVMTNDKNMAYTGGGKLGKLAQGGQQFLKEIPGSQTPERQLLYTALGTGGAAVLAPQVIAPAATVWGGSKIIKSLLESKKLGARMVAGALRRAGGNARKFDPRVMAAQSAQGSVPGSVGVAGRGQSLERPALLPAPQ